MKFHVYEGPLSRPLQRSIEDGERRRLVQATFQLSSVVHHDDPLTLERDPVLAPSGYSKSSRIVRQGGQVERSQTG